MPQLLRQIYSILLLLAVPFILLRLYIKSLSNPAYRQRIGERFAHFTLPTDWPAGRRTIWIHAVSVGEVVAASPLVKELQQNNINIVITTTTPTGSDRVRTLFADSLFHVYAPYDLGCLVSRFLVTLSPAMLILMETELWPNLLHQAKLRGIKTLLANARLSEKSATGYQRFASLTRMMLQNLDHIAAQAQADANRFERLGARPESINITGSLKFYVDAVSGTDSKARIFSSIKASGRSVIVAASTREGEESKVLAAFNQLLLSAVAPHKPLLLLIPRHPERFDAVARLVSGVGLGLQRRSEDSELKTSTDVVLGDSMGELLACYRLANIAFVGGSLVNTGCQNVLEPAALGLPIVVGPSQFNFASICAQLATADALITVQHSEELALVLQRLLADPVKCQAMGKAAISLVQDNRTALPALMAIIDSL
ncbi:MAG: lipid IV(A) 3-deoxy-D-manno-octulosonic acid transferase [Gammaproteobacteria bacterium]|nr:lipid IV(A) 3-deoxy-D-manno-octulosonic acid transferase [Gammaproteobacteria bacterium]